MGIRMNLGIRLIRLGRFIESIPLAIMKPDDLLELSRRNYLREMQIHFWSQAAQVDAGLRPEERILLDRCGLKSGRTLVLGIGGGREAIALAREGFEVDGIDFIPGMVERALANASQRGVRIGAWVAEISNLDIPSPRYDLVWLSVGMYSAVPTRIRRIEVLGRIRRALLPDGIFLCTFLWAPGRPAPGWGNRTLRILARVTGGNPQLENGDALMANGEFIHSFSSPEEIRSELESGGFEALWLYTPDEGQWGGAVCRARGNI